MAFGIHDWKSRSALLACAIVAGVASYGPFDAAAAAKRTMKLGNSFEYSLEGNPSTGYSWKLSEGASSGLEFVKVESLGYASGTRKKGEGLIVGAPAPYIFRITCLGAGFAHLVFDYVGPTKKRSGEQHETWVNCE